MKRGVPQECETRAQKKGVFFETGNGKLRKGSKAPGAATRTIPRRIQERRRPIVWDRRNGNDRNKDGLCRSERPEYKDRKSNPISSEEPASQTDSTMNAHRYKGSLRIRFP